MNIFVWDTASPRYTPCITYQTTLLDYIWSLTTLTNWTLPVLEPPVASPTIMSANLWKELGKLVFLPETSNIIWKLFRIIIYNKEMNEEQSLKIVQARTFWIRTLTLYSKVASTSVTNNHNRNNDNNDLGPTDENGNSTYLGQNFNPKAQNYPTTRHRPEIWIDIDQTSPIWA